MTEDELIKMRAIIKYALIRIGFRPNLVGFKYLCCAIELVILEPELMYGLCKGLYVKVGEKFKVKGSVERNIRHAIDFTFDTKGFMELNKFFNAELYTINDKPTCGELIKLMAEFYNLSLYKHLGAFKHIA